MTEKNQIIKEIQAGETSLGIEFGSTRIKAVLIGKNHAPIASGSYEWENQLADGIWTYSLEDIWKGLQTSYQELAKDVKEQYGETLTRIGSMGFSAMMHGYMPFGKEGNLLVPFRTWRFRDGRLQPENGRTVRRTDKRKRISVETAGDPATGAGGRRGCRNID